MNWSVNLSLSEDSNLVRLLHLDTSISGAVHQSLFNISSLNILLFLILFFIVHGNCSMCLWLPPSVQSKYKPSNKQQCRSTKHRKHPVIKWSILYHRGVTLSGSRSVYSIHILLVIALGVIFGVILSNLLQLRFIDLIVCFFLGGGCVIVLLFKNSDAHSRQHLVSSGGVVARVRGRASERITATAHSHTVTVVISIFLFLFVVSVSVSVSVQGSDS